jgi:hypothetical protein
MTWRCDLLYTADECVISFFLMMLWGVDQSFGCVWARVRTSSARMCINTCTYSRMHMYKSEQAHACSDVLPLVRFHTYIHACLHTYMHAYIFTHTYIHAYIHTHTHKHTHTHTHTHIHTHTHTYIHTYTHTHTHSHIHTYTYSHTYICNQNKLPLATMYRRLRTEPRTQMRRSPIHNMGLFASADFDKNDMVIEYVGELLREGVGCLLCVCLYLIGKIW